MMKKLILALGVACLFASTGAMAMCNTAHNGKPIKVVTYENGKKITTVYKPVGSRKVGMVGNKPYDINTRAKGVDGGEYYTNEGQDYYLPSKKLSVTNTGHFN